MEGRRLRLKAEVPDLAEFGVLNWLRLGGRINAVVTSKPPGETAESAMGVGPAAIGVWPPSTWEKNFDLPPWSPNEVMSFSAEVLAILL